MSILRKFLTCLLCAAMLGSALCFAFPSQALAASGDSFFKDSVFLGDSITVGLKEYAQNMRSKTDSTFLSNAKFLAKIGYPVNGTGKDDSYSLHPSYNGKQQQPQKSIAAMGVSKVFILLGTNDVQEDFSDTIAAYKALIKSIRNACGSISIYVLSVPPMCSGGEKGKMTNERIETLNTKIKSMCNSLSVSYIDIAPSLKNSSGTLNTAYSSDGYVHLNQDGYAAMVKALRAFAKNAVSASESSNNVSGYPARIANAGSVNLRSEASTSSKSLASLPRGSQIRIVTPYAQGSWHKVYCSGTIGFVHSDYVQFDSSGMNMTAGKIVNVESAVNTRSGPGTSYEIPFTVRKGAIVLVATAYQTNNWYLVYYNGTYVFIRKDFISLLS